MEFDLDGTGNGTTTMAYGEDGSPDESGGAGGLEDSRTTRKPKWRPPWER